MRTQALVAMALATLSLGLSIPKDRRASELDSILAALQQNNPEDAAAAAGSASAGNPRKRQQDELAAAIAALQQNNPEDAAAAAGQAGGEEKRATNAELESIIDACKRTSILLTIDPEASSPDLQLPTVEKNNPEDAAEADAVLP